MYYALACEVMENGITIELISLALVAENGRGVYVQNSSCDFTQADSETCKNVLSNLGYFDMAQRKPQNDPVPWARYEEIGRIVLAFLKQDTDPTPQFWAYYGAYDFVAFCQVFGPHRPNNIPPYFHELRQALDAEGKYECTPPIELPRHALDRARWVKQTVAEMIYPEDL